MHGAERGDGDLDTCSTEDGSSIRTAGAELPGGANRDDGARRWDEVDTEPGEGGRRGERAGSRSDQRRREKGRDNERERREPGDSGERRRAGVCNLHIGDNGRAERGNEHAQGDKQSIAVDAATVRVERERSSDAEDAVQLRRVSMGVFVAVDGRGGAGSGQSRRAPGE